MSRESDLTAMANTICHPACVTYILSCWQRFGTPHRTPHARHSAMSYTMASTCIGLTGLLAACREDIKKAQPTKPHMFSVCYIPIAGLPTVTVSRTKDMSRQANTQHMSHAHTSLDMPLRPITWCLIAWDPMA